MNNETEYVLFLSLVSPMWSQSCSLRQPPLGLSCLVGDRSMPIDDPVSALSDSHEKRALLTRDVVSA